MGMRYYETWCRKCCLLPAQRILRPVRPANTFILPQIGKFFQEIIFAKFLFPLQSRIWEISFLSIYSVCGWNIIVCAQRTFSDSINQKKSYRPKYRLLSAAEFALRTKERNLVVYDKKVSLLKLLAKKIMKQNQQINKKRIEFSQQSFISKIAKVKRFLYINAINVNVQTIVFLVFVISTSRVE